MGLCKRVSESEIVETEEQRRGRKMATDFFFHYNRIAAMSRTPIKGIEDRIQEVDRMEVASRLNTVPCKSQYTFRPSSASECKRQLFYKLVDYKEQKSYFGYQQRWLRNSTAVHAAVQKDLLYANAKLSEPSFKVKLNKAGLPVWEITSKHEKLFHIGNIEFSIRGQMDGVLEYKDGTTVGFEFKTKSNTNAQVGNYSMKAPAPYHLEQCVAYSLLFGINEFILLYEAIPKSQWTKGEEANKDFRTFYHKVTQEERDQLLSKFVEVVEHVKNGEIPDQEPDKCLFCGYKHLCHSNTEEGEQQ